MFALNIDKADGRILSACPGALGHPSAPRCEALPEGNITDYRYIEGKFILEPRPIPPREPEPDYKAEIKSLRGQLEELRAQSDDNTLAVAELLGGAL